MSLTSKQTSMKFLRTEIRIFLIAFLLSFLAFSVMFTVGIPLVLEQRLPSSKFSQAYIANFFSAMIFYFFISGGISVLAHMFAKNMSVESKIVVVTFLTIFLGTPGIFGTISLYYGNRVDPFWILTFWRGLEPGRSGYILSFAIFFLLLISTVISGIIIVCYKAYKILISKKDTAPK